MTLTASINQTLSVILFEFATVTLKTKNIEIISIKFLFDLIL